ncbi:MAG TPA: tetratricopeptide repeat protein [Sandaracinaceae bacterium LLY-WYZ-13_1]|nr:tetratricopeptide repeat protein [Sandaracinaceae bacterium LLY-WYZ-13_1]
MRAHFVIGGVPVRLDPSLPILVAVFGFFAILQSGDPHATAKFLLLFPLVIGAILGHELGHAFAGRAFGLAPFVILHALGGVTVFPPRAIRALSFGRRIVVTLAGPGVGLVLGAGVLLALVYGGLEPRTLGREMIELSVYVTLGWSLLNLIPILPLDGGHVVAIVLERAFGEAGMRAARVASIVLSLAAGASLWLLFGDPLFAIFGGLLAFSNYRAHRHERTARDEAPLRAATDRATAALAEGDLAGARRLVEPVLADDPGGETRTRALHVLAWAALEEGDLESARRRLAELPPRVRPDAYLEGRVRLRSGEASGAIGPLLEALEDRREPEVADALARALVEAGRVDELRALLESPARARDLGAEPLRRVARGVEGDAPALGAALSEALFARFADPRDALDAAVARARSDDPSGARAWIDRAVEAGVDDAALRARPELAALREGRLESAVEAER